MASQQAATVVAGCLLLIIFAYRASSGSGVSGHVEELAHLRYANTLLQQKLRAYETAAVEDSRGAAAGAKLERALGKCEKRLAKRDLEIGKRADENARLHKRLSELDRAANTATASACPLPDCPPPSSPPPSAVLPGAGSLSAGGLSREAQLLLEAHTRWDWRSIVTEMLQPWMRVDKAQLDVAVAACNDNGTMYCQRMQIIGGKMYLTDYRAIFFDRHYAPARVLPLLETLRRHPALPDMDIVVAGNDEPRVPVSPGDRYSWTKACRRWPGSNTITDAGAGKRDTFPPAIFASTVNRAVYDLPWLDFAWFFPKRPHKLRTPPWSKLQPMLVEAGGSVKWEGKKELAMHTGNVGSPYRKRLSQVASENPDTMLVNELFIGDHGKIRQTCAELGIDRKGGFQQHKCYMTFAEQCTYKYLLNSASIGYANKFKSLLLCGSVVIYVREGMRHKEFYEYGLVSGVHYVSVDKASDVPDMVRWLKQHDDYARAVAQAGRARMSKLDVNGLTDFMAEVLTQYAKLQTFTPKKQDGAVYINCEDDLWRHYSLSRGWMNAYLSQDNSTCVQPIAPGAKLGPPGWGGSYAGSKPRCYASHDLGWRAQPEACNFAKPFSSSESWEPFGQWPKPHPLDLGRERWMTD